MNIVKKTGILVVIFFALLFIGCSTLNDFYVQNFTQTKKTIKISYKTSISKVLNPQFPGRFSFNYENEIIKPRLFVKRKNLKSLEKIEVGDSALILEIPPHSTVRIERTRNYNWSWAIDHVEVDHQKYSIEELQKQSKRFKTDYVYEIK
ncbi:hypothetical protein EG347_00485 [Chryseobacterium sp. G0186]|uniref:hypothetical protein n=1 Tax=Chryseobacterium sp. G0186 TaxID=2487064 RepID=UPI000F5162DE|nr:hypothetical protein [Chryseobacterium sp. G0186]AZA76111.1 hypothetical protein EG347_00485 [Chryseobacterium sp. G0186]